MDDDELTPEEKEQRKKKALRRFRAVVRLVMANRFWLQDVGDGTLTDNVRKNIMLLTKKSKTQSPLTIKEKTILSKPIELRTEEEKAHLRKVISAMRCFRRYPVQAKNAMAECTYFSYFPPGRQIVRQDQPAEAMYYVLTGELKITRSNYIKDLDEIIEDKIGMLRSGDSFGEISLLYGIPRLATITTVTDSEMLVIKKNDFHSVIKDTLLKSCSNIQNILNKYPYFSNWDEIMKEQCAMLTKEKHYPEEEIILGDNVGSKDYVHFITKGTCLIVENLHVTLLSLKGVESYALNPLEEEVDATLTLSNIFKKYKQYLADDDGVSVRTRMSNISKMSSKSERKKLEEKKQVDQQQSNISRNTIKKKSVSVSNRARLSSVGSEKSSKRKNPSETSIISKKSTKSTKSDESRKNWKKFKSTTSDGSSFAAKTPYGKFMARDEVHFMKICELYEGACFNVGEKLKRRCVVAVTPVSCILIPRYWLYSNNKQNTWDILKNYLNNVLPNTEQVFKKFVAQKKFKKYSKSLVSQILNVHNVATYNCIHNVPYSIRLRHGTDTSYM